MFVILALSYFEFKFIEKMFLYEPGKTLRQAAKTTYILEWREYHWNPAYTIYLGLCDLGSFICSTIFHYKFCTAIATTNAV
jgi:hypothetical protein